MLIYAFTAQTSGYPPYINASVEGDKVVLIVRGARWIPVGEWPKVAPTYSASITPVANGGSWQTITATNGTAFTINAPTGAPGSGFTQPLVIEILNSSGGALGVITWNAAFVLVAGAFTNPANTFKRYIRFEWNGTKWIETGRASADY